MSRAPGDGSMPSAARASGPPDDKTFLFLLVAVSLAFGWIIWPLSGAVLWAIIAAIMFAPLYGRLSRSMGRRRSLAALVTLTKTGSSRASSTSVGAFSAWSRRCPCGRPSHSDALS